MTLTSDLWNQLGWAFIYFLLPLLSTCFLEGLVILAIFRKKSKPYLILNVCANVITNLSLNFTIFLIFYIFLLININYFYFVAIFLEVIVVLIEAFIYIKKTDLEVGKSFFLSLITNLFSFLIGLLIFKCL